jgi:16S rRNA processing protein RimM
MMRKPMVAVGKVGRLHGVRGEVRVDPMGGLPRGLSGYTRLYLGWTVGGEPPRDLRPLDVERHRTLGRFLVVKFSGVDDPEKAKTLVHQTLYVEREELPPLGEDEYYHADLIGCRVVDAGGEQLGQVVDVFATGAHDVLVVESAGCEWMLPVIGSCVLAMDLKGGEIQVQVPEGLRD